MDAVLARRAPGRLIRTPSLFCDILASGWRRWPYRTPVTEGSLNRQHLAAPAVQILAGIRNGLIDRLRDTVGSWDPAPVHVSVFGSVARGDGKTESDIDVLLIRATETEPGSEHWTEQTDALTEGVHAWTGNYCQLYELSREELAHHIRANEQIVESWRREAIPLFGPDFRQLVRRLA